MRVETATHRHLREDPGLQLADRVHYERLPQDPLYPAAVIRRLRTDARHSHEGPSLAGVVVEILIFGGATHESAVTVAQKVRASLDGLRGRLGGADGMEVDGVFLESDSGLYSDELQVYYVGQRYLVLADESA